MAVDEWFQCMFLRAGTVEDIEFILGAIAPPLLEPGNRNLSLVDGACSTFLVIPAQWRVTATQPLPPAVVDLAHAAYALGATRVELFSPDMEYPEYSNRKTLRLVRRPRSSLQQADTQLAGRMAPEQMELASVVRVETMLETLTPSAPRRTGTAYDGWPVIEGIEVDGFRLGEITDFLDTPADDGDAFIEAPDGGRAGLSWTQADTLSVEQIAPLAQRRWGVWAVTVPLPLKRTADVGPFLEAIVPLLRPHWERWSHRRGTEEDGSGESDRASV